MWPPHVAREPRITCHCSRYRQTNIVECRRILHTRPFQRVDDLNTGPASFTLPLEFYQDSELYELLIHHTAMHGTKRIANLLSLIISDDVRVFHAIVAS